MDNLPEAKNATAINFLSYSGRPDVMLVTGRFGLRASRLKADPSTAYICLIET